MTKHKHLKRRVRDRMLKAGESYVSARRNVLRQGAPSAAGSTERPHFAGNVPAATALRALLAHRGVRAPHTGQPFSEAMVFGIAGGIGAGVFAFRYEKEDFSSFFVAGRHLWEDDLSYLQRAADRFGVKTQTQEASGAKKGLLQLQELLQAAGPVIAWVDLANLPYRGMPEYWSGGGYHVIVVYEVDVAQGQATVGDLADLPITISLQELAVARARIGKQKHRLLGLTGEPAAIDLAAAIQDGLRACQAGLTKGRSSNFTLAGFQNWGEQMVAPGKEGWQAKFPAGPNLWRGLTSILDFTEHYGTGGGLTRPLFSDFLKEASQALERPDLAELAERYAELGAAWSALSEAALPDEVGQFREAKELLRRKAELLLSQGASGRESYAEIWSRLDQLAEEAAESFPLPQPEIRSLLQGLSERVGELYRLETQAAAALDRAARRDQARTEVL
jgi:hypothetical protein